MKNSLKLLLVITVVAALFSSCKKSTSDTSILEGHKWVLSSATETFSDSVGKSHNLLAGDTGCQPSVYTQFEGNGTNSAYKLAYTYSSESCPSYYFLPQIGVSTWDIDPDNTVLYMNGSVGNGGQGGDWYTISSISSSSLVLTQQNNVAVSTYYHLITDTWTYTAQ